MMLLVGLVTTGKNKLIFQRIVECVVCRNIASNKKYHMGKPEI
jgi:hypothetical protein